MTKFYITKQGFATIAISKFEGKDIYLAQCASTSAFCELDACIIHGNDSLDKFVTAYLDQGYQVLQGEQAKNDIKQ